jgi:PAS domain S-box-containing protein
LALSEARINDVVSRAVQTAAPEPAMIDRSLQRLSRAASVVAVAIGASALLGWFLSAPALTRGVPGLVTIKVNTALSFVLLGTALWRVIVPSATPPKPWLTRACIAAALALAAFTLLEYAFAVELGIDQLLVHEPRGALQTSSPGRMAPNTAVYLLAIGGALAWLDARSATARALSQTLASIALGGGFIASLGYLLRVRVLYGVTGYTSMALHTALGLCALSLGVLCARPQRGWFAALAQDNAAGAAARRLVPKITLIPPTVGWLRLQGERAGYYGAESGLALTITITCSALVVLVLRHARQQGLTERARSQAAQDEHFLLGLSELLRTAASAAAVLPEVATSLGVYLRASRCFFSEVDATHDRFVIRSDYHEIASSLAGTRRLSSLQPEGLADGRTAVTSDTRTDVRTASRYETGYRPVGIRARVAVPLRREGQWVGLLVVSMHEPRRWETREVALIEATAERAWAWTEHLAAAEAVREREQDLTVTMDSIADALITTDRDGRIQRMNPVAERLTGWRLNEARTQPLAQVFRTLNETALAPSSLERTLQDDSLVGQAHQTLLLARDDSAYPIDENAAPIVAADGTTRGMVIVFRDVSPRKQAERDRQFVMDLAELRHAASDAPDLMFKLAERLTSYLDVARSMFCDVDVDQGRFVVARDYHRDGPSVSGSFALTAFGTEIIAAHRAGKATAINDTSSDPRTAHHFHAAYEPLGIRARVAVPLIRENRWVGLLSIASAVPREWQVREIALLEAVAERAWLWVEQARLAAALREQQDRELLRRSEERFRTLVEGVKEYAIFLIDPAGHIVTWNRGAARIKGYSEAEIIGKHFSVFYPESEIARGHPEQVLAHAVRDGRYEEQGWRVRRDGSQFWADTVLTPLYDPAGKLEGFAMVARDYTERRQADEQLRERQAQLTASLKEREVLLQEVHHRVKNNLQVISSLINMQKRQMRDADARRGLDECKARVEAIALIHEQLYQAKNYASIPFSEYARSLVDNIFHATGVSPTNIALKVEIESVALAVDRAIPCGLILNELISNALKHAFPAERQGAVHVELRRLNADLLLAVGDDGIGMPAGFDLATSESLGLQLVSTLVEQLQARLEIVQDGGTTFRITFPWRQAS